MADSMAHIATDPLRNFKFRVSFAGVSDTITNAFGSMGFMSVSGLNITTDVIPYREGGMNTTTQKMPGQTDFSPITLSKGLIVGNQSFMIWMRELFAVQQGQGIPLNGRDFRATMTIDVLDHPRAGVTDPTGAVRARFKVYNAWPTSISFSDLDAGANSIVLTQATFAHEGFDFWLADNYLTPSTPPSWMV